MRTIEILLSQRRGGILLLAALLISGCSPLRFTVKPGNVSVDPGETVSVTAEPSKKGVLREIGIKYRKADNDTWEKRVTLKSSDDIFQHVFNDVREDLEYVLDVSKPSEGIGPYRITVIPYPEAYKAGYGMAELYRLGNIKDYMLVIELYTLSATEKAEFLQGFESAYAQFNEAEKGREYAQLLRESISGDSFKQGYEQGQKHVNNEVTDAQIQTLIGRSIGVSRPVTLGWKAGYIKGYTKIELLSKPPAEELHEVYREGQAMYDALRAVIGL